jgi:imidazole glycerol phosphate synthase subunit HisF
LVEDAATIIKAGADKVSINSSAIKIPLIKEIADRSLEARQLVKLCRY